MNPVEARLADLLRRNDLGDLVPGSATRLPGRNENHRVTVTDGRRYVVKRLVGGRTAERVDRCRAYQRAVERTPGLPPTAVLRAVDTTGGTSLVLDHLDGPRPGHELVVEQTFPRRAAARLGALVAALHGSDPGDLPGPTGRTLPDLDLLEGLPLEHALTCSQGELRAWGTLQGDPELVEAVADLLRRSACAPTVPVHGDLRADQLLVAGDGGVHVLDWEEFRRDDPARDLGTFVGEWLYRSVLDIPTARADARALTGEPTAGSLVQRGRDKLAAARPTIAAFWDAYAAHRRVDEELRVRAAGFAGWHLLDRLIAGAATTAVLGAVQRAAAGVGRNALLRPADAAVALGLTVPAPPGERRAWGAAA